MCACVCVSVCATTQDGPVGKAGPSAGTKQSNDSEESKVKEVHKIFVDIQESLYIWSRDFLIYLLWSGMASFV